MYKITQDDLIILKRIVRDKFSFNIKSDSSLFEELYSDGLLGLVKAAKKFDPDRGINLWAYANKSIYGTIIRGIQSRSWVTRHKYENSTEEERENFNKIVSYDGFMSSSTHLGYDDKKEDNFFEDTCEDESITDPSKIISQKDLVEFLLSSLDKEDRFIIEQIFFHHKLRSEILPKIKSRKVRDNTLKIQKKCQELRKKGWSQNKIAKHLNLKRTTVGYYLRNKLQKPTKHIKKATFDLRIRTIFSNLKTLAEKQMYEISPE